MIQIYISLRKAIPAASCKECKDCVAGCTCPDGRVRNKETGKCVEIKDCPNYRKCPWNYEFYHSMEVSIIVIAIVDLITVNMIVKNSPFLCQRKWDTFPNFPISRSGYMSV